MDGLTAFTGGDTGEWRVDAVRPIIGATLAPAARLAVTPPDGARPTGVWTLRGRPSNIRYAARAEVSALRAVQEDLGRPAATRAVLIPISKSTGWWEMAQDERLAIFTNRSRHNAIGLEYLPAVARKLYHGRDYQEPFDFLTWFEFAPGDAAAFDALLARLRATEEWAHVVREVEIRLSRD